MHLPCVGIIVSKAESGRRVRMYVWINFDAYENDVNVK